jgi:hypothetical protein
MRILRILGVSIVALAVLAALASGFVVIAAVGAAVALFLFLRRLFTGKPVGSVKFEVHRNRPTGAARRFDGRDAIDIEATPAPEKSLEN